MKLFNISFILVGLIAFSCTTESTVEEKPSVKIEILEAKVSSQEKQYRYSGKVTSGDKTLLSTKVMGQIELIPEAGTQVKKGQLLVKIKSNEVQSKLQAAEAGQVQIKASLANTRKNYERIQRLFEKGSATQKELDDISTQLSIQEARLITAQKAIEELSELISYTVIYAPIDGFVSEKFANLSDMANPGQPIIALESLNKLELEIRVPEFEIGHFTPGKEILVNIDAINQTGINVKIDRIIPSSEFSGSQYLVKANLPETDGLKPGMFASVTLGSGEESKIIVPENVIHHRGQLTGIYTINQQQESMLRWVRLGKSYPEGVEILSGLDHGEAIIASFEGKPVSGVKVEIKSN